MQAEGSNEDGGPVMRCRKLAVALASQLTPTAGGSAAARGNGEAGAASRVTRLYADYVLAGPATRVDYVRMRNHYAGHLGVSARFAGEAGWVPLVDRLKLMRDTRMESDAEAWHLVPLPPPPPTCVGGVEALRIYLGQPNPEFCAFALSHVAFYAAEDDGIQGRTARSNPAQVQALRDLGRVEALVADPVGDVHRHASALETYSRPREVRPL